MKITNETLVHLAIGWFKDIEEKSSRLTIENISCNSKIIQEFSSNCANLLEKYRIKEENNKITNE